VEECEYRKKSERGKQKRGAAILLGKTHSGHGGRHQKAGRCGGPQEKIALGQPGEVAEKGGKKASEKGGRKGKAKEEIAGLMRRWPGGNADRIIEQWKGKKMEGN